MQNPLTNKKKGFTLIEMIVSLALFSIVAVIGAGALLKIIAADKKAESLKTVINNMNFALESLTRESRMGTKYFCTDTPTSNVTTGQDCTDSTGKSTLEFVSSDGRLFVYSIVPVSAGIYKLQKSESAIGGALDFYDATSPDVKLTDAFFKVTGSLPSDIDGEPGKIFVFLKGYTQPRAQIKSEFTIQTTVSQRLRE